MKMDDRIKTTLSEIKEVMGADSIVGSAIYTKNKTVIPISKVALGFGLGQYSKEDAEETALAGVGGGGSIDPIAFLVISDEVEGPDGVELITIEDSNPFDDIVSSVGKVAFDILGNMNKKSSAKKSSTSAATKKSSSVENIKTKIKSEK